MNRVISSRQLQLHQMITVSKLRFGNKRDFSVAPWRQPFYKRPVPLTMLTVGGAGYVLANLELSYEPQWYHLSRLYLQGIGRFLNAFIAGLFISFDYKWEELNLAGIAISIEYKNEHSSESLASVWSSLANMKNAKLKFDWSNCDEQSYRACHLRSADRLVRIALENGGLYVKLGQGLASLNHVLPEEYVKTLAILQDKALPQTQEQMNRVFLEDLGELPSEIFREFNVKPIAAASLAQVHHAITRNGEEVAVKIQYRDLRDRFTMDMLTTQFLCSIAARVHPKFDFAWMIQEVWENMEFELDFLNEAKNMERCKKELGDLPHVYIPKIYYEHSSKRILTTEFIHGCKVNDRLALEAMGISVSQVAKCLIQVFAWQMFRSGYVHADPHPGNILIRPKGRYSFDFVLLDHGLYVQVENEIRHSFAELWKAIVLRRDEDIKRIGKTLGVNDHILLAGMILQRPYISDSKSFSKLTQLDLQHMHEMASKRMDAITEALKQMPSSLLLVFRNLNQVRGINKELGVPVNRFNIMARSAMKALQHDEGYQKTKTTKQKLSQMKDMLVFDTVLRITTWRKFFFGFYLQALKSLGCIPRDLGELEDIIKAS